MEQPPWVSTGLKQVGVYYEGIVDDVDEVLERHSRHTVTTYGTRTSSKPASVKREVESSSNQENEAPHAEKKVVSTCSIGNRTMPYFMNTFTFAAIPKP